MTVREEIAALFEPAFSALAEAQASAHVDAYLASLSIEDAWADQADAATAAARQHVEEIQ